MSWFSKGFTKIFCLWHALIQELHFNPQPPTRFLNPAPRLLNISQSRCNETMKFGQLKQNITKEIFSFKNYAEYEAGWLVPDLFMFFKKAWCEVKVSGLQLSFNKFQQTCHTIKRNCIKFWTNDSEICSISLFRKKSGTSFSTKFCVWSLRKMFLTLHSVNDQISLSNFLYFFIYWVICVLKWFVNHTVTSWNFKLTLSF